ncbi:toxin [Staphylococcus hominis]|uniref:ImmA/IrrE family metallo-endopeptidase n=1 Tax=Staphylococcus hominis TaxID=1290 RepID=UPI0008FB7EAB|nr:ImmA/IrrE family metallo-endopeptidase [Staphylococcus hominis]KAF1683652.1 toxin [Staphylococcus hominis]OIS43867.1 toxin [Staphylococcus hominis]OIS49267.1 toxin [Staphylococcus hominis]OIS50263.1 toxin [Staphylococcus hominis]
MGRYEDLIIKYNHLHICDDFVLPGSFSGIYNDGVILIDKNNSSEKKLEILAEELAHHEITHGNIINQKDIQNKKYELKARRLAYEKLISLKDLIDAYLQGINNLYELANFFEVTEQFILETLEHYKQKHGYSVCCDGYIIQFEPLRVFENKN